MSTLICRLCLTNSPNMKAHIMAEGLMKLIHHDVSSYDGRFILVGSELKAPIRRPSGSYDKTILCDQCDNKLGEFDRAAIEFCQRADLKPHPSGVAFTLSGVDQEKLKLFAMSYVWRASITSLDEYNSVHLGDKHEAKIAEMLRDGDVGGVDDYSVVISKFNLPEERKAWGMHILNPVNTRLQGINTVDVYLPNLYKWKIKVDNRPFNGNMVSMSLGATDDVIIMDMGDYAESKEFSIMHAAIMKDKERFDNKKQDNRKQKV